MREARTFRWRKDALVREKARCGRRQVGDDAPAIHGRSIWQLVASFAVSWAPQLWNLRQLKDELVVTRSQSLALAHLMQRLKMLSHSSPSDVVQE